MPQTVGHLSFRPTRSLQSGSATSDCCHYPPCRDRTTPSGSPRRPGCRIVILILSASIAVMPGCRRLQSTDYSMIGLIQVSGVVLLDGTPLASATVIFEAEDQTYSFALTDDDGHYELQFNSEQSGVTPGKKVVRISSRGMSGEAEQTEAEIPPESDAESDSESTGPPRQEAQREEQVPACYHRKSQLQIEVTSATTVVCFDLRRDCSTTGAQQ